MTARLAAFVLECPDPQALAEFYRAVLGWEVVQSEPGWAQVAEPGRDRPRLSFQLDEDHRSPVWSAGAGQQQMQAHLDIGVDDEADLADACRRAESAGAVAAGFQPQEGVRVYLDPAGHPFCFFLPGS